MASRPQLDIKAMQISCRSCSLSELCLPHGLNEAELAQLDNSIERKSDYERGNYLYRVADPLRKIYAVRSGSFKAMVATSDGTEQITGFYLSGDLLGLDGLADELHTCNVVALENSSICELPFQRVETLCGQLPGLMRQMMRLAGREISHDHQQLLALGQMSADERFATFLLNISQRHKQRGFSDFEFNLTMTRYELANYLGLAVETLSRLFSRFQENGLINVKRRRIEISNMSDLQGLAQHGSSQIK